MCSAASQHGMSPGTHLGLDGGRFPPVSPQPRGSGVGRAFPAGLALWSPFSSVGVVSEPHPALLRGAGVHKSGFLHLFPPVLLDFFFFPASDLLMFKKLLIKKLFMWSRDGARASGGGVVTGVGGGCGRDLTRRLFWGRGQEEWGVDGAWPR